MTTRHNHGAGTVLSEVITVIASQYGVTGVGDEEAKKKLRAQTLQRGLSQQVLSVMQDAASVELPASVPGSHQTASALQTAAPLCLAAAPQSGPAVCMSTGKLCLDC